MATYSVDVYNINQKLGSGTASSTLSTITSYTGTAPGKKFVQVTVISGGSNVGKTYTAYVVTDGGATLTMNCPCNYN